MNITIKNFKCFSDTIIPINNLTVLAGVNGSGKSSIIQSLLLLRKAIEVDINKKLELRDLFGLNLGYANDLLNNKNTDKFTLGLSNGTSLFSVDYQIDEGEELYISTSLIDNTYNVSKGNPLCYKEFYYLTAERIGPRIRQDIKLQEYSHTGEKGEYTAQTIVDNDLLSKEIDRQRKKENTSEQGSRFLNYINGWLSYILEGVTVQAFKESGTPQAYIKIKDTPSSEAILPTNTGFGISYCLPIIVTGLLAPKDRLFVIENPEAHLHPAAQSRMGFFLAQMAEVGVRIVVETHSDHIINGIQLAVANKIIASNKVSINFFGKSVEETPLLNTISLNERGELSDWPRGFFDQTQIDFMELMKLRNKNV